MGALIFVGSVGEHIMYLIGFDIGGTKIEAMLLHFGIMKKEESYLSSFEFQKSTGEIVPGFVLYKK